MSTSSQRWHGVPFPSASSVRRPAGTCRIFWPDRRYRLKAHYRAAAQFRRDDLTSKEVAHCRRSTDKGALQRPVVVTTRKGRDRVKDIVTEDFVLDSPTTRHTNWFVQGQQATSDYLAYVLTAYPDLEWEVIAPPMFRDDVRQAAFSWRGTGHFTGVLTPPGIQGTGEEFDFSGLEVFSFRGDRACYLNASYDLIGLTKQIGVYQLGRTRS
ncbi:MAG TPA: nuclear transport factor 2 family protein [Aldersonia sp.]